MARSSNPAILSLYTSKWFHNLNVGNVFRLMHLLINLGLEDKMSISTTLLWTDISRKVSFLASNNIAIRTQNVQSMTELPDTFPLILLNKTPWALFAIIKSNNWKEETYRHSQRQLHNALLSLTSAVVVTNTEGDTECHQLTPLNYFFFF